MGAAAAILEQRGKQRRVDDRGTFGILAYRSSREKRLLETEPLSARHTPDGHTSWALAHGVLAVHCVHLNVYDHL